MKRNSSKHIILFLFVVVLFTCCKKKQTEEDDFDRTAMLENLGSNLIAPGYDNLTVKVSELKSAADVFSATPNTLNLVELQNKLKAAYIVWEGQEVYEFGPAANIVLKASVNTFRTDTTLIKSNVASGTYDLESTSNFKAKGFPALDYLVFGTGIDNAAIVTMYTSDGNAANRKTYLINLIDNLSGKINSTQNAWNTTYKETFKNNASTDLGSSVSLLVNAMSMSLESVRRERIGNPLGYVGLVNTGTKIPGVLEAYFGNNAKALAIENLQQSKNLFNGGTGLGFDDYLDKINAKYENGNALSSEINTQFDLAITAINDINPDIITALNSDEAKVEKAFLEVKKLVVLVKLDMSSQLGVVINYSDNDGD